jgi:uncharacterized protein
MDLLHSSAEHGFVPAMVNLGFLNQSGKYSKTNYSEAFHWFSLAAEKGNPDAQAQVGGYYHTGKGVPQDYSMAAKWYRRAADQHNYEAMKSLGYLLLNGMGVEKDLKAAKYWSLRAATEGNHRRAMLNLGAISIMESSNSIGMAEAFRWYKQSADLGDPLACLQVANFYYHGWGGVGTNLDHYYDWLSRAANLGSTEAEYFMGQYCRTGTGMQRNPEKSLEWYRKAAAKNDPRALYDLAVLYAQQKTNRASLEMSSDYMLRAARGGHRGAQFLYAMNCFSGDVIPQNFELGKEWLAKSAENGWPKAEFILFQLYYNGSSLVPGGAHYPKDTTEGIKWLRRAAEQSDFQAESMLAVMMIQGKDMETNLVEAKKLLRDAATHGYAAAENDLGFAIMSGALGERDWVEAAVWCKLAESQSSNFDTETRSKVNSTYAFSQLTEDEHAEADRRIKDFRPIPTPPVDPMAKDWEKNPEYFQENGRTAR